MIIGNCYNFLIPRSYTIDRVHMYKIYRVLYFNDVKNVTIRDGLKTQKKRTFLTALKFPV